MIFILNLHSLNGTGIGLWCNGNTTVFGAVFLGSSPSRPTFKIKKPLKTKVFRGFLYSLILEIPEFYIKRNWTNLYGRNLGNFTHN